MTEKEVVELVKYIIGIPGVIGLVFWCVKWVANDWFEKRVLIEKLKEKIADEEKLKTSRKIDELEAVISIHNTALMNHTAAMIENARRLDSVSANFELYAGKTSHSITEYARLTHERLKRVEKDYQTEQKDLGNGKVLIKNKS